MDKDERLQKTFGEVERPKDMAKAKAMMDEAVSSVVDNEAQADIYSDTLRKQAKVAEKFEMGMDKITDVLLVVGMKMSQTSRLVILGLVGVGFMIIILAGSSLHLFSEMSRVSSMIAKSLAHLETVERAQLEAEVKINKALMKAELVESQVKSVREEQPKFYLDDKGRPIVNVPIDEHDKKIRLRGSIVEEGK